MPRVFATLVKLFSTNLYVFELSLTHKNKYNIPWVNDYIQWVFNSVLALVFKGSSRGSESGKELLNVPKVFLPLPKHKSEFEEKIGIVWILVYLFTMVSS